MNRYTLLGIVTVIVFTLTITVFTDVYAQEETVSDDMAVLGYVIAGFSFVGAGLYYTCLGYVKKLRRVLAGENVAVDLNKVRNSALLGVLVGVVAFIASLYNGETIHIVTVEEFIAQASINFTAVVTIDKLILGRADSSTNTVSTGVKAQ